MGRGGGKTIKIILVVPATVSNFKLIGNQAHIQNEAVCSSKRLTSKFKVCLNNLPP